MNNNSTSVGRVIGLDAHPDSFTVAVLRGQTPAQAFVEKTFHKVPMAQLQNWAQKHTQNDDLLILEASGNSFQVVRTLRAIGRRALGLGSGNRGNSKEPPANTAKIAGWGIGRAYLAGTARELWLRDEKLKERRAWSPAHGKAPKRSRQMAAGFGFT